MSEDLKYEKFNLRPDVFMDEWLDDVEELFKDAAKEFVQAAISNDRVPVDTGMAKGSYLNLGSFLGVNVPISSQSVGKTYYPYKGSLQLPKTPQSGASLSDYVFERTSDSMRFYFSTEVYHFALNDLSTSEAVNDNAPWNSFEVGLDSFMKYFEDKLDGVVPPLSILLGVKDG